MRKNVPILSAQWRSQDGHHGASRISWLTDSAFPVRSSILLKYPGRACLLHLQSPALPSPDVRTSLLSGDLGTVALQLAQHFNDYRVVRGEGAGTAEKPSELGRGNARLLMLLKYKISLTLAIKQCLSSLKWQFFRCDMLFCRDYCIILARESDQQGEVLAALSLILVPR